MVGFEQRVVDIVGRYFGTGSRTDLAGRTTFLSANFAQCGTGGRICGEPQWAQRRVTMVQWVMSTAAAFQI